MAQGLTLLLLQRTRVQFPIPVSDSSHGPITLGPEDMKPFSDLHGATYTYVALDYVHVCTRARIHAHPHIKK